VDDCPSEAITLGDCAEVNAELCTDCGTCADNCPSDAITIEE
jgi:ferredoxin